MADHSKPVLTSLYANFLSELDTRIDDVAVGLDPARVTVTNPPTYTNRWNSVSGKWEQWNGTSWVDMASVYNININGTVNNSTIPTGVTITSTSNKLSVFSATTSAELAGVISDETGTGYLVFGTSPTISTPTLTLKQGTSPTAEGAIEWDSTNDKIIIGDGTGQKYFIPTSMFNTDITVSTTGVVTIGANVVSNTKFRQSGALTVVGRSANSTGDVADIAATATSGAVLRESGSTIGFGQIGTAAYADSSSASTGVTYAKMQYVSATDKILGRSTAGSGNIEEITCTSFGRALLDDTSVAAQRTTLGLQYFATYNGDANNYVEVTRGGTGAGSSADALNNLLPSGELSGYVLKTSGPGTYYWAAEAGGTTNFGTTITSSRAVYTATAGQTVFTSGTYVIAAGQTRIYVNGVRLYLSDYTETSTTSITLNQGCTAGDQVMVEIDGYVVYNPSATDISFSPTGNIASTTVQTALAELDTEKQVKITANGILKGDGSSNISAATGTDVTTLIGTNAVTNATNLNGSGTISSTTTASTQSWRDSSTKLATTAYVDSSACGVPSNTQAASYTCVLSDAGKSIDFTGSTGQTITIPANASVAYPVGTTLSITNTTANNLSIAITTDTMRQAGTANTGTRTLSQYGVATARKIASTTWIISGAGLS